MMQYQRTVNSLAVKLDAVKPGWAYLVDTDKLNLRSVTDCVLGQVFADEARNHDKGCTCSGYGWAALRKDGPFRAGLSERQEEAFACYQYKPAWIAAIEQRRASVPDVSFDAVASAELTLA